MRVLFAAAEFAPLIRVGGLAEAAGGLINALDRAGLDVTVVLPDYGDVVLDREARRPVAVPPWAGKMWARSGKSDGGRTVTLLGSDAIARPHPYADASGFAWPDNDARFMQFSAGVATLRDVLKPDVTHLNDWHTAAVTALGGDPTPTVLTIHTLGYQGVAAPHWMGYLTRHPGAFEWYHQTNPLLGGIKLADRVVAVSPNYSREILTPAAGMGLHEVLAAKGEALVGIRNGIDTHEWDPAADGFLAARYSSETLEARDKSRQALADLAGWEPSKEPVIGVVSRLVDQKGIDILLASVPFLGKLPAKLFVLGSGQSHLAAALHAAAAVVPQRIYFHEGYDLALAHRIFAGSDLFAMPSRFEPCGLAQMQAMRYGSIPVVTPVGGLVDTVVDADASPRKGTGFVADTVDAVGFVDALHRAVRAFRRSQRRRAIQRRGMEQDWSWDAPAQHHIALYEELAGSGDLPPARRRYTKARESLASTTTPPGEIV